MGWWNVVEDDLKNEKKNKCAVLLVDFYIQRRNQYIYETNVT